MFTFSRRLCSGLVWLACCSVTFGQDDIPPSPADAKPAADEKPAAKPTTPVIPNTVSTLLRRPNDPQLEVRPVELVGTESIDTVDAPWFQVFDDPASFDWMGFDSSGSPIPRDRLTIYEGMTVWVYADGRFRIKFYAETPITVTTLRLQLQVSSSATGMKGTITIPPIRLTPVASNGETSKTYSVTYAGSSDLLKRMIYLETKTNKLTSATEKMNTAQQNLRTLVEKSVVENQFQNNSKELDAATRVLHRARETARNAAKEYDEIRKYAELRRSAVEKSAVVPTSENLEIKFSRSGTARFGSGVN